MPISDHSSPADRPIPLKTVALEAAAISTLGIGVAALLSPRDAGLATLFPYPIWLAVALLATRYGSRGLMVGLLLGWGLTAFVTLVLRLPMALVGARTSSGSDLGALLGVVLVGWVASTNERRCAALAATASALKERGAVDHQAVVALRAAAVALRARADRLEMSLTFLRDVAARLDGSDPAAAAQAALDLAVARTGARAGVVVAIDESGRGLPMTLASCGGWGAADLRDDPTAASALRNRRATRAIDVEEAEAAVAASDLAAPIFEAEGDPVVGLIALRGVPQGGASPAALHDLGLIAGWSSRAIGQGPRQPLPALSPPETPGRSIVSLNV